MTVSNYLRKWINLSARCFCFDLVLFLLFGFSFVYFLLFIICCFSLFVFDFCLFIDLLPRVIASYI